MSQDTGDRTDNDNTSAVEPIADRPLAEYSFDELDDMPGSEILSATLVEKEELLAVPLMITRFIFRQSDTADREYVSVEAVTRSDRVVFNDGSTGIRDQLVNWAIQQGIFTPNAVGETKLRENLSNNLPDYSEVEWDTSGNWRLTISPKGPIKARHGLRKSDYPAREVKGKKLPAGTTYYLA